MNRDEILDVILEANPHVERRIRRFRERGARWTDATPIVHEAGGRIVSVAIVYHRRVWTADGPKRFAGLGAVATRPGDQGRGYASAVLEKCDESLRQSGYPLAVLFCVIPEFYRRFGWTAVEEDSVEFPQGETAQGYEIGPVACDSIPENLRGLYRGAIERTPSLWDWYGRWVIEDEDLFLTASWRGEAAAYVRGRRAGDQVDVLEAAWHPEHEGAVQILLGRQAEIAGRPPGRASGQVMMIKSIQAAGRRDCLLAEDFQSQVPWSPRVWWGIDRF